MRMVEVKVTIPGLSDEAYLFDVDIEAEEKTILAGILDGLREAKVDIPDTRNGMKYVYTVRLKSGLRIEPGSELVIEHTVEKAVNYKGVATKDGS